MKYQEIRSLEYQNEVKVLKNLNADITDKRYRLRSPYTFFKILLYIEGASILVFLLQHTPIKPNWITLFYAIIGIVAGLLLASGENNLIITAIIIYFFKVIIDGSDGLLARVKNQTSHLGALLDNWAGLVNEYFFLLGFGMYLFNVTQQIHFLLIMMAMILIKAIDLKDYTYYYSMYSFFKGNRTIKELTAEEINNKIELSSAPKYIIKMKDIFQDWVNYHAKTTDLIGLIIIFELHYNKIILTNYIYYIFFFKMIALFIGGFYLLYFKKFDEKVISKLKK